MLRETVMQIESIIKYIVNFLGLAQSSRASKRAIKENLELTRTFEKALFQALCLLGIRKIDGTVTDYISGYKNKAVRTVKLADIPLGSSEPIVVCPVNNDLTRVKAQLEHHRQIGVRHFAYIDNDSTDGTFEWLHEQSDVSLFAVSETFSAEVKPAWVRQVTDIFGYDRWYLKLDSDEFFTYPGAPDIPITKYIEYLETKSIEAVLAPMIDMYSTGRLFGAKPGHDFREQCCYFDTDTYKKYNTFHSQVIAHGPRERLFHSKLLLSKYPLIKAKASHLLLDHSNFPYNINFQTKGAAAFLLHYKFLDEDYGKYLEHIESGVHVDQSRAQKTYIQTYSSNPDASFYHEGSQELTSSMDLLKINICDHKFFEGLL